ncbi:CHAT domain-containing protein [Flavobacterium antarcticum]|uniref:CHAT domain-containing protein n=1 Tax=Flavobacterium antarcticum TaxID=271155 RepID=UPI00041F2CBC|nr:CHAT domain-containing protein [Flavobacterium antarcticum]
MKKIIILLFLLGLNLLSAQEKTVDKIYESLDRFIENPTPESIKKLESDAIQFTKKTNKSKDELLALVILNCNKAYYENKFGATLKAISTYENAWKSYQENKLENYDIGEYCLKPLGNLYTIVGDYESAENTIKQYYYLAILEKNQAQKIGAILNLSNVYQSSGKTDLAILLLEKTIKDEELAPLEKGKALNNLGTNYMLLNDFGKAKQKLELSLKYLQKEKNQEEVLSNTYRNLAFIENKNKNFTEANSNLSKAETLLFSSRQNPRKIAKFFYDKALIQLEQGNAIASRTSIKQVFKTLLPNYVKEGKVVPSKKSVYADTVLMEAIDLQAEIYAQQNKFQNALECYTLSFYIEDLLQTLLFYENSKIISQVRSRNRSEKCIQIYYVLYQKTKNSKHLERAFQYAENNKASVLKAMIISENVISIEKRKLFEQIQELNTSILKEQQKFEKADIEKINQAINKQNELMLSVKSLKENKQISNEDIPLEKLFKQLEHDKTILISYFYGSDKLYSFLLENHAIKLTILENDAKSQTLTSEFLEFFSDANKITTDVNRYNTTANKFYNYLNLPKKSNTENLIILPDGILNFVPFEALITKSKPTSNFAEMSYFLHDYKIAYNNSAYFYLTKKPFHFKEETILGVFPIFENTNLELAYSKKELEEIKANFKGLYLEKDKATFNSFKHHAAEYSILHLSTHASSGDIYTPASLKFYDEEILYSELYNLNIHPDLVVLSACETGMGKWYKSEGAMSISRGFQLAGAKNLLFSLWKVNDYTTSVFMEKFYKNLKKSGNYREANHQAKLDFLNDEAISNSKKSPYYWSAMVYYGTMESKSDSNYLVYILVFLGAIALILLLRKFIKGVKK